MSASSKVTGISAIGLAIVFNLPFGYLAQHFDYPDVLRRPSGEVLALFAAGGDALVWAWYVFGLSALAFVPMAFALSVTKSRMASSPALVMGAAVSGALAGLVQAMGLFRWVFVVPVLARHPESAIAQGQFDLMNAYAGVAIGEHMGQIFTALFVGLVAVMQWGERKPVSGLLGYATAALMVVGSGGGMALALGRSDAVFSTISVFAYLALTVWLIATGIGLIWSRKVKARAEVDVVYV